MKRKKSSSTTKTKVVKNARTKVSEPSAKSESDDMCKAYLTVEVPEKDLRSMLKNFSDKMILNIPGMKQERIREIECKFAGYETKKRKILKIVSRPGEKNEEISHTANTLQKIQKKIGEKPKETTGKEKRRKSPEESPSTEPEQIKRKKPLNPITEDSINNDFRNPISENETRQEDTEDFIEFNFPIDTRTSVKLPFDQHSHQVFSMEISTPSPTMNHDSSVQPLTFDPFSNKAQIKGPTHAPACQQTSSSQQFPSAKFGNDTLPSENYNRPVAKNLSPAVQQVSSGGSSSNMVINNMLPAVEYTSSSKESTCQFSNKMNLNGFRENVTNNLQSASEQQSSALAPFSRNETTNGSGKIRTHNESLAECSSSQQFTTESFSKVLQTFSNLPFDQSLYQVFSVEISKPSPTMNQDLPAQPATSNPFLGDAQIKVFTDAPAYKQTSCSQQLPSVAFLNDIHALENYNRPLARNQSPADQHVSSTQQFASTAFSSNIVSSNTLSAVEYNSSSKESRTRPFSNKMPLNGFRDNAMSNLVPAVEQQQTFACEPFSSNSTTNGIGKIKTYNESPAEFFSSLQQSNTVSFSNVVPLNTYNATQTDSEIINISKKSFNEMYSNQKSSVKELQDQRFTRDCIARKENLVRSHVTAVDDSKHVESDKETNFGLISSDLSNIRSKIWENISKKKIEAVKDNKQNVPPLMDLSSNNCAGKNNPGNLKNKVDSSANRIQHGNCNAENSDCNKNQYSFKFSTPIYNYVDVIPSDSETAASPDTNSNIPQVTMENCIISNSSPSPTHNVPVTHNVFKAGLVTCGLPKAFASPRPAKDFSNIENGTNTPTYRSGIPENSLLALSEEDRLSANSNDSIIIVNSNSVSASSQRSSCDSYLMTSSSTDEHEENVEHSSSFDCDPLRLVKSDINICEEYSTNATDNDLGHTEPKFSFESILSPTSMTSFNDEESKEGDSKSSTKSVRPQRQSEIKPFQNGSLYWLKKGRCVRKNYCESRETLLTRNSGGRNCNYDSLMAKFLMSSRSHEKGRSETGGEFCSGDISKKNSHQQELSVQENDKKNSKKINITPKIEAAEVNNKMQLEQLSTNQILAQIGLNVLTNGWPSPKNTNLEKILTICGYNARSSAE